MATKQYKTCDLCNNTELTGCRIHGIFLQTGWQSDPAGGPSEADGKDYDLCDSCMVKLVQHILRDLKDFELHKKLITGFEEYRKTKQGKK